MDFKSKYLEATIKNKSFLCVGLDPEPKKIPLKGDNSEKVFTFCKEIIDATIDLVCVFKPQIAYFSAYGLEPTLEKIIAYIKEKNSMIPILLDAKRGDIGSTAEMYAHEVFDRYGADAVTVSPYLGSNTIGPFTAYKDKGVFVLAKTSNPSAVEFQDKVFLDSKRTLYQEVVSLAMTKWNTNHNINFVTGATYPQELADIRILAGDEPIFLCPGIGAQGGDLEGILKHGLNSQKSGVIISASRSIIYASAKPDFADAARGAAEQVVRDIRRFSI